jgi:hypothetical protein
MVVAHVESKKWLCLWTAVTNGSIIHPPGDMWVLTATVEYCWQGKRKKAEKTLSQCHFPITNPTWNDQGAIPGLCGEVPASIRPSHGIALFV